MKHVILLALVLSLCWTERASSQGILLQDRFRGGVCADGFAPDIDDPGNPANLELNIPFGATVRKVLVLAGEHDYSDGIEIMLDGDRITLDPSTRRFGPFFTTYGEEAFLHEVDITSIFDPLTPVHTIRIPPSQGSFSNRFSEFYVVVLYASPTMEEVQVTIVGNEQDFAPTMDFSIPQHEPPTGCMYGLAIMGGYVCNPRNDGELVMVNGQHIGTLDTNDTRSGICGGPVGSFKFENGVLYGVGDDTPDARMGRNDALADISSYLNWGDDRIDLEFVHALSASPADNSIWAMITVSGTACCPLYTRRNTLVCVGDPFQLQPGRDLSVYSYQWTNLDNGEVLEGAAPLVTPTEPTRYLATIQTNDGCMDYDTVVVDVQIPTTFSAAFTQDRSVFDGESGEISMVVRAEPPALITSEKRITLVVSINRDLIELNSIATDKPNVQALLRDRTEGFEVELILPADYGIFDSIHVVLSGKSFLTVVPSDSARVVTIEETFNIFCTELLPSPVPMVVERSPECVDHITREAWAGRLHEISVMQEGRSIVIQSDIQEECTVSLYDLLGRRLMPDRTSGLPLKLDLPSAQQGPMLIHIRSLYGSYSRLLAR